MTSSNKTHWVYWIRHPHHTDPWSQGYVGVTVDPVGRLKRHTSGGNQQVQAAIQTGAVMVILHQYPDGKQAYLREFQYRPTYNMGWNRNPGGNRYLHAPVHTQASREAISRALTGRPQTPERIARRVAARAGYRHSEATRQRISLSSLGKHQIKVSCVGCKREFNRPNMTRHWNSGCKKAP